jgi:AraC-like DNA-binding protein
MSQPDDEISMAPAISASGVRRWSTDTVPQSQRLDYWVGAICEGFEELEASSSLVDQFGASLESAACGPIMVHRVEGSTQEVFRTKRAIARSDDTCFYLLCKPDGAWAGGQGGDLSRLLPGDCMLFDSKRPYQLQFSGSANVITLQLPVDWVQSWLPDPEAHCGLRIDGGDGWGQPLSSFVRQLSPEVAAAPPLPAKLMTDQLGSLLALGTHAFADQPAEKPSTADAFMRDAIACLRHRHAECGLTARDVAAALHVSERTLHRHFAHSGATFLQHLVRQRMATAQRMLRDPRFDRLTVAEIGRRVGFADASHFIRQCRASLGLTPVGVRGAR